MNKLILSLGLTIIFSVLIVLGVTFFKIISQVFNNNFLVLIIGFILLFLTSYFTISESEEEV